MHFFSKFHSLLDSFYANPLNLEILQNINSKPIDLFDISQDLRKEKALVRDICNKLLSFGYIEKAHTFIPHNTQYIITELGKIHLNKCDQFKSRNFIEKISILIRDKFSNFIYLILFLIAVISSPKIVYFVSWAFEY